MSEELVHVQQELSVIAKGDESVSDFSKRNAQDPTVTQLSWAHELDAYAKLHEIYGSDALPHWYKNRYLSRARFHISLGEADHLISRAQAAKLFNLSIASFCAKEKALGVSRFPDLHRFDLGGNEGPFYFASEIIPLLATTP